MNAVQDYLIQKLLVPKIYFDADWNGFPVQVLAIDRAGSGDVHAIWFQYLYPGIGIANISGLLASKLQSAAEDIRSLPSHYRYVAVVSDDSDARRFNRLDEIMSTTLAQDGVGRVGILYVDLSGVDASVKVLLKAERFRSSKDLEEMTDRFVATHTPNWQIPDEDRL